MRATLQRDERGAELSALPGLHRQLSTARMGEGSEPGFLAWTPANGLHAWAEVLERGYEGYVGKDEESPYREGLTLAWLKVKVPHYRAGERGWEPTRKS